MTIVPEPPIVFLFFLTCSFYYIPSLLSISLYCYESIDQGWRRIPRWWLKRPNLFPTAATTAETTMHRRYWCRGNVVSLVPWCCASHSLVPVWRWAQRPRTPLSPTVILVVFPRRWWRYDWYRVYGQLSLPTKYRRPPHWPNVHRNNRRSHPRCPIPILGRMVLWADQIRRILIPVL